MITAQGTLNELFEEMGITEMDVPVTEGSQVTVEKVQEDIEDDIGEAQEDIEKSVDNEFDAPKFKKEIKMLTELPDSLKEVLNLEKYEERTQKVIARLDEAGVALLETGLSLGYTVDVNNTYIGLKNLDNKLVARIYTVKKGNRLYTFEAKLDPILTEYKNGEITCMGKPGVGNTNTFITLNLLNEEQRKQILITLDPSN